MIKTSSPAHLRPETKKWFAQIVADYQLESQHLKILTLCAEAFDRCSEARETIAKEGAYYRDRFDAPRAHPAVAVERDSRISAARLLRELALDVDPPDAPRPPALKY